MGFEYKIRAKLTPQQISEIEQILSKNDYFEQKYWVKEQLFWDFRHSDNHEKLPNVSLIIESDGVYICQWSAVEVWHYLDELKNYLHSQNIPIQIIDYQE